MVSVFTLSYAHIQRFDSVFSVLYSLLYIRKDLNAQVFTHSYTAAKSWCGLFLRIHKDFVECSLCVTLCYTAAKTWYGVISHHNFLQKCDECLDLPSLCFSHLQILDMPQSNLDGSNTDGSFTMANSNSFLSPYEILLKAQENKCLRKFSYFIVKLYVVCTH